MIDFIGIGAQKCGTTWLYEHLRRHPDIAFPAGKEVHFWDQQRHLGSEWWAGLFPHSDVRIRQGEITPAYAILDPDTIREIRALCPDAALFISLRNPMARAWSSALMALGRAEMTFGEAGDQWFIDHFRSQGSLRRGNYAACIDNWTSVYPVDRLQIIWFDEILAQPQSVLRALAVHIGAEQSYFSSAPITKLRSPVFAGSKLPVRATLVKVLRELYLPSINVLEVRFGRDLTSWKSWSGEEIS